MPAYMVRQRRERNVIALCDWCAAARGIDTARPDTVFEDPMTGALVTRLDRRQALGHQCNQCHRRLVELYL